MTLRSLVTGWLLLWVAGAPLWSQSCDCLSTGNCPVPITDNGSFQGALDITVNGPNDLGENPLTAVCFTISHTWIGDLSVSLTAPDGTSYLLMADQNNNYGGCGMMQDNIDVCIVTGTGNPLTNNTEYQCNPAPCALGFCCLNGNWTVACGGVTDPLTGSVQAPGCDLNDFNVPGSPANGTWTLTVNDVCNMDTGVLHNFSLHFANGTQSCLSCEAEGGQFDTLAAAIVCPAHTVFPENLVSNFPAGVAPDTTLYGYTYVITRNDTLLAVTDQPDLGQYPAGTYRLYGLSYYLADSVRLSELPGLDLAGAQQLLGSPTETLCADLTDNCLTFELLPELLPTTIDTVLCQGQCLQVGEELVCGSDTLRLETAAGCDSLVVVRLTFVAPDTSHREETVCPGEGVAIGDSTYTAPGIHTIIWADEGGCDQVLVLRIETVPVMALLSGPDTVLLTCENPAVTLDAGLSVGQVLAWNGPQGQVDTGALFSTGTAGAYTLVATASAGGKTCRDTLPVLVIDSLVPPQLELADDLVSFCTGEGVDLASLLIGNSGGSYTTLTYHDAFPVSAGNQLSGSYVQPDENRTYYLWASAGICEQVVPVVVQLTSIPEGLGFSMESPVCAGDTAFVTYTGAGGPDLVWEWETGGGVSCASDGLLQGLVWDQSGTYAVTSSVTFGGCTGVWLDTQWVEVSSPPVAPLIGCHATTESVTWYWEAASEGVSYEVALAGGGVYQPAEPFFTVGGLAPGDSVTMTLTAVGSGACGSVAETSTCAALPCPDIGLELSVPPAYCRADTSQPIQLSAVLTGADADAGTWHWSGGGMPPGSAGWFDPQLAASGTNLVTVTYTAGNCAYAAQQEITVNDLPEVDLSIVTPLCQAGEGLVHVTGAWGEGTQWEWDYDGATVSVGADGIPQALSWPVAGLYEVEGTVTAGNCPPVILTAAVEVEAPVAAPGFSCEATTGSVVFFWDTVPGATGYEAMVTEGPSGIFTDLTSYTITGLPPGTTVALSVSASGDYACGAPVWEQTCASLPCPPRTLDILAPALVCVDGSTGPLVLGAEVGGGSGADTLSWHGVGMVDTLAGLWDPVLAGSGVHTVSLVAVSGNCIDSVHHPILVAGRPDADAGPDQAFDCRTGPSAQLGSGTFPEDAAYRYSWTAMGKAFPGDPTIGRPTVNLAGTFRLTVTDTLSGCQATDEVTVTDLRSDPVPIISLTPVSCRGAADGELRVDTVMPGIPPFLYTLDGETQTGHPIFSGLVPGTYELTVEDMAGCEGGYAVELAEADSLWVTVSAIDPDRPFIRSGERIRLAADVSVPAAMLDDIRWTPSELLDCAACLTPTATLYRTTTLDLSVRAGGCLATAAITVLVDRRDPLYVPTAFTPNGDGTNDVFRLYAGPDISRVTAFRIFDRWGEAVFACEDFLPSDETGQWDGTFRGGRPLDAGVFVWTVQVERMDGTRESLSGEVNLIR